MNISKEEILHIANLSSLELKDEEVEKYAKHLEQILEFANIVNNANTEVFFNVCKQAKERYNIKYLYRGKIILFA